MGGQSAIETIRRGRPKKKVCNPYGKKEKPKETQRVYEEEGKQAT